MTSIGDALRAERERQGISLRALARKLGMHPSAVSEIERGIRSNITLRTFNRFANELGVRPWVLLRRSDDD